MILATAVPSFPSRDGFAGALWVLALSYNLQFSYPKPFYTMQKE